MTAGDICTRNVVVAPKTETVVDAAKRMRSAHVGDLVVVEARDGQQVPIGIVTDRDIVVTAVAGDSDHINYLLLGDVMTANPVTVLENDTVEAAVDKMQEFGIRRLPIVNQEGALTGIVTFDDVLRYLTAQHTELMAVIGSEAQRERQYRT